MRFVKYIGPSHVRQITAQDWRGAGIDAETVTWLPQNGFAVALDSFTEEQIRKAIDPDPFLVVTGEDEDFEPVARHETMTPDQHRQSVENPVDVLALANGVENVSTGDSESSTTPGGRGDVATDTDAPPSDR